MSNFFQQFMFRFSSRPSYLNKNEELSEEKAYKQLDNAHVKNKALKKGEVNIDASFNDFLIVYYVL